MTNPFLAFLQKLQQDLAPIEAAALSEAEQVALIAVSTLVGGLVNKLSGGTGAAPAAGATV